MESIEINTGPLTSFNSLVYHLGPKFQQVRNAYAHGETPKVIFDFRNVKLGILSVPALTAFLSSSKKLREFLGYPIPLLMTWDPELQGFLADIGFFETANRFKIFSWEPDGILGGYRSGRLNPLTKILYYADKLVPGADWTAEDYLREKALRKQKIAPNFLLRCSKMLEGIGDDVSVNIITNTVLELIVNSLIHAQEDAFVGFQVTKKRVTVSVCDSGIGFPKSLIKSLQQYSGNKALAHADGIFIGSLVQKNQHGLRLAISEVLNFAENDPEPDDTNQGWVSISSFNAEIRWQKNNWETAIKYFDKIEGGTTPPKIIDGLGAPSRKLLEREMVEKGFWRNYDSFLIGTRITFEIMLK